MHALELDFARRRRPLSLIGLLLLLAGAAAAAVVATDYAEARANLERLEARQARLERQARQAVTKAPPARAGAVPAADAAPAAALAVAQLRLPWDALLGEIERIADAPVALLGVEGRGDARSLRLTGEAKSMDDAVGYLARLRQSPLIASAHLSGHEERQAGAVRVIRFSLDAVWSGSP